MKQIAFFAAILLSSASTAQTWTAYNTGCTGNIYSISFPNNDTGYVVDDASVIRRTNNGGATWSAVTSAGSYNWHIGFATGLKGVVCGDSSLYYTSDGGATWTIVNTQTSFYGWSEIHFYDANVGYAVAACTGSSRILKTTNGGASWSLVGNEMGDYFTPLFFTTASIGYGAFQTDILQTTDGGATWVPVYSNVSDLYADIHFPTADTGYALSDGATYLVKTTNGGVSWSTNPIAGSTANHVLYFKNGTHGFVGGGNGFNSGYVLETTNSGANWMPAYTSGITWWCLDFPSAGTGYFGGDAGKVLKYTAAPNSVDDVGQNDLFFYPNPASDFINIQNISPGTAITIFDLRGNQVDKQVSEDNYIVLDIAALSQGVYFIEVRENKMIRRKKVIVQ
jgi:photosystem II stability/assembly factor-like uncharacterized protein